MEASRKALVSALGAQGLNRRRSSSGSLPAESWDEMLLGFLQRHNSKADDFKMEELVETLSEKDLTKMWGGLAHHAPTLVKSVCPDDDEGEESDQNMGEGEGGGHDEEARIESSRAFRLLHTMVILAHASLAVIKACGNIPPGLLTCAQVLHDSLFSLDKAGLEGIALQASIAKLCEQWWKEERPGAESLIPQLMPYLLVKTLEDDSTEALIKRVYAMRGALMLFDYEDEATETFQTLLLQCFLKPTFLRSSDGRRFLTCLFGLHPDFIDAIHGTIKNQLPQAKKKVVQAYADVYFRAWKGATGPYLERIEHTCIQDLMHSAIYCATQSLFNNLRQFLNMAFHSQKRLREVDSMLLRLYNPIIWRSSQVANPAVRSHATWVLTDAFPLQNPDAGTIEVNALLQKQFDMLQSLLKDPDPRVRVAAVEGVTRVLSVFWEAVPIQVVKAYIGRLVGELAFDSSSAPVRLAVVEGLATLLEQPLSHAVLKQVLPSTAPLLHDKSERVRSAFLSLLTRIKAVRDIKFYHVVQVDHILARFAEDTKSSSVSKGMAELLLNSYFPQGPEVTGAKQVSRCLTFLRQNKPAALAFYGRLRDHVSLGLVVKLAVMLLRCVFTTLAQQGAVAASKTSGAKKERKRQRDATGKKKGAKGSSKHKEDNPASPGSTSPEEEGEEAGPPTIDEALLASMLEVVWSLWNSVAGELEEEGNEEALELLVKTLQGQDMVSLYGRLSDVTCLLRLAALSPEPFASLREPILHDLRQGEGAESEARVGPILALLCLWGDTKEVSDVVVASLSHLARGQKHGPSTGGGPVVEVLEEAKKGGSKGGRGNGGTSSQAKRKRAGIWHSLLCLSVGQASSGCVVPIRRALVGLNYLLAGADETALQARNSLLADEEAVKALKSSFMKIKDAIDQAATTTSTASEVYLAPEVSPFLAMALESFLRLSFHAAAQGWLHDGAYDGRGGVPSAPLMLPEDSRAVLQWATDRLLPAVLMQTTTEGEDGVGTSPSNSLLSPTSPPLRRSKASSRHHKARSDLATMAFTVVLTVAGDWLVSGVGLADLSLRCEAWGHRVLTAVIGEEEQARARVQAILPQLCKLYYQLTLQESRGARAPASLMEILLRTAHYQQLPRDNDVTMAYDVSGVDSQHCLSALLRHHGRLGSQGASLEAIVKRIITFCTTEEASQVASSPGKADGDGKQDQAEVVQALCEAVSRSSPALQLAVASLLSTLDLPSSASLVQHVTGSGVGGDMAMDPRAVDSCGQVLWSLLKEAPQRQRSTMIPKVVSRLEQVTQSLSALNIQIQDIANTTSSPAHASPPESLSPIIDTITDVTSRLKSLADEPVESN